MEEIKKCCICGKGFIGWGNDPYPIKEDGECCDACNSMYVIPARIYELYGKKEEKNNETI